MSQAVKPGRYTAFCLCLIFTIIFADQYLKWLVLETALRVKTDTPDFWDWFFTKRPLAYFFTDREEFRNVVFTPWLNFVMVWNQGVSFGMFDTNTPGMAWAFIGLSLVISLVLLIWLALSTNMFVSVSIALVVGGALGNVMDRMRFGAVADFIDAHIGAYHWPAFNLADSYIVLGAAMLAVESLMSDRKGTKK